MPFDPFLEKQFEHIQRFSSFDDAFATPEGFAAFQAFQENPESWEVPRSVAVSDESIDGPHGPIPVRIYRPTARGGDHAGLLWMHGGAFMFGDLDQNESHMVSAELCARANAVVVSVGYRLAVGGVKHPVPLDDVVAAWGWLVDSAVDLGINPARISIGGASAGGNLATSASMRVRNEGGTMPRSMLLAYPLVHWPVPPIAPALVVEMQSLPALLHFDQAFHEANLLGHVGRLTDFPAGVAPGNFALEGMPPAFIAPAEYDELRTSGELFARQLQSVGIEARVELAEGMVHGHLDRNPSMPAVEKTLQFFAGALA